MSHDNEIKQPETEVEHYTTEELDKDPVYQLAKTWVLPGHRIKFAKIEVPKVFTIKGPKKLLKLEVETEVKGSFKSQSYQYNYNKILREIKQSLRKENSGRV